MSCVITIEYPNPKEEAIGKLRKAVEDNSGTFKGDATEGWFRVGTPLGSFEVEYTIAGDTITVNVIKKPILISCKRIKKEIEKYLEQNPGLHNLKFNV